MTYGRIVADLKPHKEEKHCIQLTVGGDKIDYDGELYTAGASITTVKTHINSAISTANARYVTGDIENFYLNTKLPTPEYMRLPARIIPEEIMLEYKLKEKVHEDSYVYIQIDGGMYSLPQAGS